MKLAKRPPRPVIIPDELMQRACQAVGAKPREIAAVVDDPRGLIVTTTTGTRTIMVPAERPDGIGQTGSLVYPTPGRPVPRGARVYVEPSHADPDFDRGEPWTVEDLRYAASKEIIPAKVGGPGGPSWMPWVGDDPIKAFAVWAKIAKPYDGNLRAAIKYNTEAAACRRIVLGSELLSADEADKL